MCHCNRGARSKFDGGPLGRAKPSYMLQFEVKFFLGGAGYGGSVSVRFWTFGFCSLDNRLESHYSGFGFCSVDNRPES